MRLLLVLLLTLLPGPLAAQNDNRSQRPLVVPEDQPENSATIQVVARGLVRNTLGHPLPNAAVELQMNPYHPTSASTKNWTATDVNGRYEVSGSGHHGTARVRVAAEGHRQDFRELHFIRSHREISFNFALPPLR